LSTLFFSKHHFLLLTVGIKDNDRSPSDCVISLESDSLHSYYTRLQKLRGIMDPNTQFFLDKMHRSNRTHASLGGSRNAMGVENLAFPRSNRKNLTWRRSWTFASMRLSTARPIASPPTRRWPAIWKTGARDRVTLQNRIMVN
jgi:hypothetical protein